MDPDVRRNIAFLLSLGALPACNPDEIDPTTGSSGGGTSGVSHGGTTGGAPTTSTGDTTTDGDATGSGTTGGTDDTGGASEGCAAYVEYKLKCDLEGSESPAELFAYCTMIRKQIAAIYGPACLTLHDAADACLAQSACDDPDPCAAEIDAANACMPEPEAACIAYAAKVAECYEDAMPDEYAGGCQAYVNYRVYFAGPACGAALEDFYACLVDLPCAEFSSHAGCDAQQSAVFDACSGR